MLVILQLQVSCHVSLQDSYLHTLTVSNSGTPDSTPMDNVPYSNGMV